MNLRESPPLMPLANLTPLGINNLPEVFYINIPTLLAVSSIVFVLALGIWGSFTHWDQISALRYRNRFASAISFSYFCFLLTCVLTIILLSCYGGWVCIVSATIIAISFVVISLLLYYGLRTLWEYIIYKNM